MTSVIANKTAIGFCLHSCREDTAHISVLTLRPEFRHTEYAYRAFIEHLAKRHRSLGAKVMTFDLDPELDRFWPELGLLPLPVGHPQERERLFLPLVPYAFPWGDLGGNGRLDLWTRHIGAVSANATPDLQLTLKCGHHSEGKRRSYVIPIENDWRARFVLDGALNVGKIRDVVPMDFREGDFLVLPRVLSSSEWIELADACVPFH